MNNRSGAEIEQTLNGDGKRAKRDVHRNEKSVPEPDENFGFRFLLYYWFFRLSKAKEKNQ